MTTPTDTENAGHTSPNGRSLLTLVGIWLPEHVSADRGWTVLSLLLMGLLETIQPSTSGSPEDRR